MTKKVLAVYDVDPFYADRFTEYVNQREKVPFVVMSFTTLERLRGYIEQHPVEVLLISAQSMSSEIGQYAVEQIIMLTDGEAVPVKGDYPAVFKFQSSENIIREVMSYYCENPTVKAAGIGKKNVKILGVYSPVSRCLKTSFAITLGQLIARDEAALYLNLEEYSGFPLLLKEQPAGDLSDMLYFFRQGNYNILRLGSVVHSIGNLDYIPPVRHPEDLVAVAAEELAMLVEKLALESRYETIILDIGSSGKEIVKLLELCNIIYMPIKEDSISVAKLEAFDEHLKFIKKEELNEKIRKLKLPYHSSFGKKENYVEQLLWGELGDYVRSILKGSGASWTT